MFQRAVGRLAPLFPHEFICTATRKDPEDIMAGSTADHYIPGTEQFLRVLETANAAANGFPCGTFFFTEKPALDKVRQMVAGGGAAANPGQTDLFCWGNNHISWETWTWILPENRPFEQFVSGDGI